MTARHRLLVDGMAGHPDGLDESGCAAASDLAPHQRTATMRSARS